MPKALALGFSPASPPEETGPKGAARRAEVSGGGLAGAGWSALARIAANTSAHA